MKTAQTQLNFPDSLVEWAPHAVLVTLTLEAIERCEDQVGMKGRWPVADYEGFQPKLLLSLLTYGYAAGIYGSEEIHGRLRHEPGLAYLSAGAQPKWNVLMRFRRENKHALSCCLEYFFKLVWTFRFEQSQWDDVDWDLCDVITVNDWFTPELTRQIQEIVRQRVLWALQSDTAFLDA